MADLLDGAREMPRIERSRVSRIRSPQSLRERFAALAHLTIVPNTASSEVMLEARLLAPCCYLQTLDVHESPLAAELRAEIHRRVEGGEATTTIESDLVTRYGEHVRAMPPGRDTRDIVYPVAAVVMLAAITLAIVMRRWLPASKSSRASLASSRDELDDRIDAELADLEA